MRSLRIVLLAAATALVFAPAALAKGPSKAEVNGPGLKHAIVLEANGFNGGGDAGPGTPLGDFTQEVGFFPAAYQQSPSPMRPTRPTGTLGPKYTVTYTVPDGSGRRFLLHQDLYPYAKPVPVTYMAPGQDVFGMRTGGGWYVSESSLRGTLIHAGLPASAPSSSAGDSAFSFLWDARTLAIVGALALLGLVVALLRRRPGPARA